MGYYKRGKLTGKINRYQIRRPYYKGDPDVVEDEMELVEKQSVLLSLEKTLEKMQLELRALELDWLDERVTLDDILEQSMKDSRVADLCVWGR